MNQTAFETRKIRVDDVPGLMLLSNAEGWNQTADDWQFMIESGANVSRLVEKENKIIGSTTAMSYSNSVAWIGMVLVDREYRRQGISKTLLEAVFEQLSHYPSIKLDATPDGKKVYQQFGFEEEYQIVRMTHRSANIETSEFDLGPVENIQDDDLSQVIALDQTTFGTDRNRLINFLFKRNKELSFFFKGNDRVSAFVLGREGARYFHIGPVVAASTADAKMLISRVLGRLQGIPVVVDVPLDKEVLIEWLKSIGFVKQRHFIRMYRYQNPFPGDRATQYLIGGPEYG